MDEMKEARIIERVAETLARHLPDVSPISVKDGPDSGSYWPTDWGTDEQNVYRAAARQVMSLLRPLLSPVATAPRRAERDRPFFVRHATAPSELEEWLRRRPPYTTALDRFDRAGNPMFCLRGEVGNLFEPAGLVVVTSVTDLDWVRAAIKANARTKERV